MNGRGRTPPGRASSRSGSAGIEFAVVIDPSSLDMQSLQAARASLHVAWAALIFSVFASGMSIVISAASLRAARAANRIAEGSLGEAKAATQLAAESLRQAAQVAERDLADWRQTKWFDLFFQAQQMCDALEYFQATYAQFASAEGSSSYWGTEPMTADFNDFLRLARRTLSMASVFPKNAAIDGLAQAMRFCGNREQAFSRKGLVELQDAVHDIRELTLLRPEVLLPPEMLREIKTRMKGDFDSPAGSPSG